MVLWKENSYAQALEREQLRRRTMARLSAAYGSRWRRLADQSVVWNLVHSIDVEGAAEAVRAEAERQAKAELRNTAAPRNTAPLAKRKPARSTARRTPGTSGPDTDDLTTEMRALAIIADEPDINGSELGRRLEKTERYGRELLKKLAPVASAERMSA